MTHILSAIYYTPFIAYHIPSTIYYLLDIIFYLLQGSCNQIILPVAQLAIGGARVRQWSAGGGASAREFEKTVPAGSPGPAQRAQCTSIKEYTFKLHRDP